ncbi:MAG: hypothetical protein ACXAAN_16940 [Candidatus Thorarchaeota archaeon]
MERVVEPESKRIEFDVLTETKEKVAITGPTQKARRIYRALIDLGLYAKPLSGFAVIVALLFVPLITIPGMVILVLVAEVYLLDWTYSKVSLIRDAKTAFSNESTEKSPEDEIDRKVARPGPKDQFIR